LTLRKLKSLSGFKPPPLLSTDPFPLRETHPFFVTVILLNSGELFAFWAPVSFSLARLGDSASLPGGETTFSPAHNPFVKGKVFSPPPPWPAIFIFNRKDFGQGCPRAFFILLNFPFGKGPPPLSPSHSFLCKVYPFLVHLVNVSELLSPFFFFFFFFLGSLPGRCSFLVFCGFIFNS